MNHTHTPVIFAATLLLAACTTTEEKIEGERISVLSYEQSLTPDPRVLGGTITVPPAFRNREWNNAGGFASHTAYHLALDGLSSAFETKAVSANTNNRRLKAPPVMADGKVFALGSKLDVAAIDAKSGAVLWKQSALPKENSAQTSLDFRAFTVNLPEGGHAGEGADTGFGGGVAYDNGRLFVSTGFGEVLALAGDSGEILWRIQNEVPFSNAPTVRDGRLYVVARDSRLLVFSTDDGGFLWEHSAISENATIMTASSPAVSEQLVVAGFNSGEVVGLRNLNGTQVWADTLSGRARLVTPLAELNGVVGRPVIDRDRAFAINHGGRMVAIDLRTGERIWTADIASAETPWVMGDYVLVMSLEGELICLSRAQGRVRWVRPLSELTNSDGDPIITMPKENKGSVFFLGPVLAGGRIIALSSSGTLLALSPQDGALMETIDLRTPISVPPIIADGTLYVLTDKGSVLAFN